MIVHFGRLTYRDFAGSLQPLADLVSEYENVREARYCYTSCCLTSEKPASIGDCSTARRSARTSDPYPTTRAGLERPTRVCTPTSCWTFRMLSLTSLGSLWQVPYCPSIGGGQHHFVYSSGCLMCRDVPIDCGSLQLVFARPVLERRSLNGHDA